MALLGQRVLVAGVAVEPDIRGGGGERDDGRHRAGQADLRAQLPGDLVEREPAALVGVDAPCVLAPSAPDASTIIHAARITTIPITIEASSSTSV